MYYVEKVRENVKHLIFIIFCMNLIHLRLIQYIFSQCLVGTDVWQRVNTGIPVKSPRFALFDLAEDKSYTFRVRSCNSAGVGEPSEETGATTVGDRLGECEHSTHTKEIG